MRETIKDILRPLGLLETARGFRDRVRATRAWRRNARYLKTAAGLDGLPFPPARLILLATGTTDLAWYVEGGRRAAASLRSILERNGVVMASAAGVLDFGCGCGRVIRHWQGMVPDVHGCDYNADLVAWCARALPFASFARNGLHPPLPYPDGRFGFVYALSVFTHLPEALQRPWMGELARVTRRGGHVAVSLHGERYLSGLTAPEREAFAAGRLVVREDVVPGSNVYGAYHPRAYVEGTLTAGLFDVTDFVPEGAWGNPHQDLYLLARR